MASQNQNGIRYPKRERVYFRSPKHSLIAPRIASIPCMSSKICPIKNHCPMTFSDSQGQFCSTCPRMIKWLMVLEDLESHPYLARALRYAPSKITALWHLVTLMVNFFHHVQEFLSGKWDGMILGLRD